VELIVALQTAVYILNIFLILNINFNLAYFSVFAIILSVGFYDTIMFTNEQAIFLEISEKENKVLSCVRGVAKNLLRINKDTGIPRATLYLIIQKLHRRGLVKAKMEGRRCLFQTTGTEDLKYLLQEISEDL
jgi:predicted transcriptional regulator